MKQKLYRNRSGVMLGGVCGGLGDFFGIDSNLVRIIFVVLALIHGIGIPIYLVLWLIVPPEGETKETAKEAMQTGAEEIAAKVRAMGGEVREVVKRAPSGAAAFIGIVLILLGILFLLSNLGVFWIGWVGFRILWPILLIIVGAVFLWRRFSGGRDDNPKS
jgi:phage shock protein C